MKKVAYQSYKYGDAKRAKVLKIDTTDGYGAQHKLVLCDENWQPVFLSDGSQHTVGATSRQIKEWDDVEEGQAEREFAKEKQRIIQALAAEKAEQDRVPLDQVISLFGLCGVENVNVTLNYGGNLQITVPAASKQNFLDFIIPTLTDKLFVRSFGQPAIPAESEPA
jgi:hypothetical protein